MPTPQKNWFGEKLEHQKSVLLSPSLREGRVRLRAGEDVCVTQTAGPRSSQPLVLNCHLVALRPLLGELPGFSVRRTGLAVASSLS